MENHAHLLIQVGGLIIAAKLIVALCNKMKLAPVFGMVILGVIVGPAVLNFVHQSETMAFLGNIGVMMLLFLAGLETDMGTMRETGKVGLLSAIGGVSLPFMGGFLLCYFSDYSTPKCYFTGAILTATSVSVTVMTLWEMGKLRTSLGSSILSAAIIDDIMGILILVLILSVFKGKGSIALSMGKVFGFLCGGAVIGLVLIPKLQKIFSNFDVPKIYLSFAFATMFLYAGIAEICGIASITGAYMAGLFLGRLENSHKLLQETESIAQSIFMPLFFASIGLVAKFDGLGEHFFFIFLFVVISCITKIIGSGLTSKIAGLSWYESLQMGIGMMPRGEVALVIASIGLSAKLITPIIFNATIVLVIISAAITPILLKLTNRQQEEDAI